MPGPRAGKRFSFSVIRRRLRRRFALRSHPGHATPSLIEFGPPYDWDTLGTRLGASGADLLICFGYGKLIPRTVLELFPNGGLNLASRASAALSRPASNPPAGHRPDA
ncbi:hypothetical protein ACVOMV_09795 [Mesorhizobium atlanticum]